MQRTPTDLSNTYLINTTDIELWPASLLHARSNREARALATGERVLRRKRDGLYLAASIGTRLIPLRPRIERMPGIADAVQALRAASAQRCRPVPDTRLLPLDPAQRHLRELGIDPHYGERHRLPAVAEPARLRLAGRDRYGRLLWLLAPAAAAWQRMRRAAATDGIALEAISGFRSQHYQRAIFERKLARGLSLEAILAVNAAPGHSEHHSGRALDIGTPGEPPAEESFEAAPAFAWLSRHAAGHGFSLSYPRGNPHGVVYEPWHWCWNSGGGPARPAGPCSP